MVGAVNGVLGNNYWNWNGGGNPQEFTSLSNMVAGNANQVLALTRRDPNIMNLTGLTSLNELVDHAGTAGSSAGMHRGLPPVQPTLNVASNEQGGNAGLQPAPRVAAGERRSLAVPESYNHLVSTRHIPALFTGKSGSHLAVEEPAR
jgi:hypothetical protein